MEISYNLPTCFIASLSTKYFTKEGGFENVMDKLNHRPQKKLNYKSPHTVFFGDPGVA